MTEQKYETEIVTHISISHDLTKVQSLINVPTRSMIVCSTMGLRLWDLLRGEKPRLKYQFMEHGPILLGETALKSESLVMVRSAAPCRLKLHAMKESKTRDMAAFRSAILAVKLSQTKIVVLLQDQVIVLDANDVKAMYVIDNAIIDPRYRACAMSFQQHKTGATYLAYPSSKNKGEVAIIDIESQRALLPIDAHDSDVVAMSFNANGNLIATASEKGTVVRVFQVLGRVKLHELQRGLRRYVTIQSLSFNDDSTMLACSSDKETVHIFKLDEDEVDEDESVMGYITKGLLYGSKSFLPTDMSKALDRKRAFATVPISTPGEMTIAAWSNHYGCLLIASKDGILKKVPVHRKTAGEWPVGSMYNLLETEEEFSGSGEEEEPGPSLANGDSRPLPDVQ